MFLVPSGFFFFLLFLIFQLLPPSAPGPTNRSYRKPLDQQPRTPSDGTVASTTVPVVHPPHCAKAIVTVAQSSRLTRRASTTSSHPNSSSRHSHGTQLSLDIAIRQSVCFTVQDGDERTEISEQNSQSSEMAPGDGDNEDEEMVSTESKSNFSFIVALTGGRGGGGGAHQTPMKGTKNGGGEERAERVLHSVTILELEQYHAITERYRFAIPELETRCLCECESGTANCAADRFKYGRCDNEDDEDDPGDGESDFPNENDGSRENGRRLGWAKHKFGVKPNSIRPLQYPPPATVCHRTFFANQPSGAHCSKRDQQSSSARLCCQLRFRPFRGRQFTALRLESGVSSALIQYSQWIWREIPELNLEEEEEAHTRNGTMEGKGRKMRKWEEMDRRRVRIQLDGSLHSTVLNEPQGLKLSVLGLSGAKAAGSQIEPGVYFVEHQPDGSLGELIGQMPVNRITEHDFHKLGWFRLDERGRPFVQSGDVLLDRVHHARVEDCAEQRFRSVLDASYYVNADNNETTQFRLADPLSAVHKWVRSARVLDSHQRIALVRAREGLSLGMTLATTAKSPGRQSRQKQPQKMITFVHNSSLLGDFTAMMLIDRFSNSLLNLTLFNASGVLNGFMRRLSDHHGSDIDGFSVNVPAVSDPDYDLQQFSNSPPQAQSVLLRIKPYPLGSIHIVCLRPDDADLSQELCRPVQTIYHELEVNTVKNEWSEAIGECPKCNQISAEGFAKYLNPANWVKGISSVSDAFMLASDIFGYFLVILVLYVVVVKIVIPLLGCCCFAPSCSPTSSILCRNTKK